MVTMSAHSITWMFLKEMQKKEGKFTLFMCKNDRFVALKNCINFFLSLSKNGSFIFFVLLNKLYV